MKEQIAEFSRQLDMEELYRYMKEVKDSSDQLLLDLSYADLKRKMTEKEKAYLRSLQVVSTEESACWLIDYWCKKMCADYFRCRFPDIGLCMWKQSGVLIIKFYHRKRRTIALFM